MEIIDRDWWLCSDCTMFNVNGDLSGIDSDDRASHVERSAEHVARKYGTLVPDWDSDGGAGMLEFSSRTCAVCGDHLAGGRHRFALLK